LELSEDLVLGRLDGNFAELRELAALGINLAIDDFGRGRSSLLALADLDMVTVIKLDREFVCKLPTHAPTRTVFAAVRHVASSLDMRIIGEGVESTDEAHSLADLGVDCVQGYLFGRPMPAERASMLLHDAARPDELVVDIRSL
jgi:EAL domain-containing protein (putative c-di-GMP-specific phosphodiesterase class I)